MDDVVPIIADAVGDGVATFLRLPCGWDEEWTSAQDPALPWAWYAGLLRRCSPGPGRDDSVLGEDAAASMTAVTATHMAARILREVAGEIRVRAHCDDVSCAADLEILADADETLQAKRQPGGSVSGGPAAGVRFRLPSPADLAAIPPGPAATARAMLLGRCLDPPVRQPDRVVADAVEQEMARLSAPPATRLKTACPACRRQLVVDFDPIALLAAELRRTAAQLDDDIHLLAWHYHWSHAEIMGLPTPRRRRRVRRLTDEVDGWGHGDVVIDDPEAL